MTSNSRVGLIDADGFIYQACFSRPNSAAEAQDRLVELILTVREEYQLDYILLAMSCPRYRGFRRRRINPNYKVNRDGINAPLPPPNLNIVREYARSCLGATEIDGLEADDVISIRATGEYKYNHLIISHDKDMHTIPGNFARVRKRPRKAGEPEDAGVLYPEPVTISEDQAFRFLMQQVLMGDPQDGYPGVFGIGPKKSARILSGDLTQWEMWMRVVETYKAAGLSENHAIQTTRQAYLLQAKDYNFSEEEITFWSPLTHIKRSK